MWMFDGQRRAERRSVAELTHAVRAQLQALGEPAYELVARTRDDHVLYRRLSAAELLDRVRDLRGENRAGTEFTLRPAVERTGLVLLRHLDASGLEALGRDGFPPVLVVGPAPDLYDAWVRLDAIGIQRGLHAALAQTLALRYGADPESADRGASAPLAGFRDRHDRWTVALVRVNQERPERQVAPGALALVDQVLDHVILGSTFLNRARTVVREPQDPPLDQEQAVSRAPDHAPTPRPGGEAAPALHDTARRATAPSLSYAEQFGAYRQTLLEQNPALNERQADWGAAHRLVQENPGLGYVPLVRALDQGGAAGQGSAGRPLERTAYIAQTAQKVLAAQESGREAGWTGTGRSRSGASPHGRDGGGRS
jgi:hypothetical protein